MPAGRRYALLLVLALGGSAHAGGDALLLIDPDAAGPKVDPSTYFHPTWVIWPPSDAAGSNLAMSLLTGHDWRGRTPDASFRYDAPNDLWKSEGWRSLWERGFFQARREAMGTIRIGFWEADSDHGRADALLLALGPERDTIRPLKNLSDADLVVGRVASWDEAKAIAQRVPGRTLVVESPPPDGRRWSRFWTYGGVWPNGIPETRAPGLVPARDLGRLLRQPSTFRWTNADVESWGGANRWLEAVRGSWTWAVFALVWLTTALVVGAAFLIVRERRSLFAARIVSATAMVPAAVLVAGNLCRWFGLGAWWILLPMAMLALPSAAWLVHIGLRRRYHPWLAVGSVGLFATVATSPDWSVYSPVFGWFQTTRSGEAGGAIVGYLLLALVFGGSRFVAWALAVAGAAGAWWGLLPLAAVGATAKNFRYAWVWCGALATGAVVLWQGAAWTPGGLLNRYAEADRIDLSRHVQILGSPSVALALLVALSAITWGDRFFFRQARRLLALDSRRGMPFRTSAILLAAGIYQPAMLQSAQILALGGLLLLLHDGLREL